MLCMSRCLSMTLTCVGLCLIGCRHLPFLNNVVNPGSPKLKIIVRLDQSAALIDEVLSSPDNGVPKELIDRSVCVIVVPGLQTYSLVVGAEWGSGFVVCRKRHGSGWSGPGAVSLAGGSFGIQVGTKDTDLLLFVMNHSAESKLLANDFTIGANASAAAGPVGRSIGASTNAVLRSEILSWSRASGMFEIGRAHV